MKALGLLILDGALKLFEVDAATESGPRGSLQVDTSS